MLVISLTIISAFTFFALQETNTNREYIKSIDSHYISESGIEDATYRIVTGKQIGASQYLAVGDGTTTVNVTTSGNNRTVRSEGTRDTSQNNMETTVNVTSQGASFFYGVQVDAGGITMGNGAQIIGNVFSNGSISGGIATGNATVATGLNATSTVEWPIGCTSTCGDSDNFFATTTTNQDIAQSFTATSGGALNKVSVFLGKNATPTADITLRITTDVSGHPNSSQISNANATIARASVGATPSWIDVTFATPPTLTNGTKYWIVLDYTANSATNYWNWRKDKTDGYANNTGKKTTSWSSGGAVWVNVGGDLAFRLWIGGTNNQIANAAIGGTARAPAFLSDTANGSPCPPTGPNCIISSDSPQSLPISDGVIQDWRDEAAAGGTVAGQNISGTVSLGPKKINGDLNVTNGAILIVTGTLWVTGQFQASNNAIIKLTPAYGANSGVIISDGVADISNNVAMSGSGQAGSYIMLAAAKNATSSQVLDVSNNTTGAIYYAPHGRIHFNNNAGAKEVTGYGFDLDNNATVTYESGLQSLHFTSGPSGGYSVNQWHEVK